ncbi:MAG TPA: UDP-3-O-[3-hydroxymyristoyl] N-acetylglucosamine deacetylase, partial [Candidatus Marinimicrobia bacterium]|nr:UDP-3-O-[3-hydroxymyristoyl] N-acetylglucosamine deacetylase [Candidatus Neomarinimicrobiota bacterium]
MNSYQHTIFHPVSLEGIGLHTGKPCRLTIKPAPVNHGICFVRTDIPDCPSVPARTDYIVDLSRGT